MLKLEKKILCWLEKHMFLLTAFLSVGLALYYKRIAVWWTAADINFYFDDHVNSICSAGYYLLVKLVQYLPFLPLHSMKYLTIIADYVVAVLCVIAVGGHKETGRLKSTFYFAACVLSPVAILRGAVWAQMDAVAFAFLLGGYILWEKQKKLGAVFVALPGIVLYPCFFVVAAVFIICRERLSPGKVCEYLFILTIGVCLLQGICGVIGGKTWSEGIVSGVRWLSFDPYLGERFTDPLQWAGQMVNLFGYSLAMLSGIAAYRHKISYVVLLLIHLAVPLVYGSLLFY